VAIQQTSSCCCSSEHFTTQEVAILELIAAGLGNDSIGRTMHLSTHTIASHISLAMRRAHAHSRAELVARGFVDGILGAEAWPPHATGRRCLGGDAHRPAC
jgi:DNA-binding NarL/FixJ family response regulator